MILIYRWHIYNTLNHQGTLQYYWYILWLVFLTTYVRMYICVYSILIFRKYITDSEKAYILSQTCCTCMHSRTHAQTHTYTHTDTHPLDSFTHTHNTNWNWEWQAVVMFLFNFDLFLLCNCQARVKWHQINNNHKSNGNNTVIVILVIIIR